MAALDVQHLRLVLGEQLLIAVTEIAHAGHARQWHQCAAPALAVDADAEIKILAAFGPPLDHIGQF
jgi:hypothetical protein